MPVEDGFFDQAVVAKLKIIIPCTVSLAPAACTVRQWLGACASKRNQNAPSDCYGNLSTKLTKLLIL